MSAIHCSTNSFYPSRVRVAVLLLGTSLRMAGACAQTCGTHEVALQILGSGGPYPSPSASTGYLVWLDGRSAILVDVGGGVFLRFGEAKGRVDQLELIAISHLHPDHVSDLPALLWLTGFRTSPLRMIGPSGDDQFPEFGMFLEHLFRSEDSAFPILARSRNRGQGGAAPIDSVTVDVKALQSTEVLSDGPLKVTALGVPHTAPALAYRVASGESSIVFSSDQNGSDPRFVDFARGTDILVMHFALSKAATGALTENHATPTVVGRIAAEAGVKQLILSHVTVPRSGSGNAASFSAYSPSTLEKSVEEVRRWYGGPVTVAEDLQCFVVR